MANRKIDTRPHCRWAEDDDGNWDTACDEKFVFFTGGPRENKMKFCPYCGELIQAREAASEAP